MTNCQKMSSLSGLQTVKEGDSYKAAELLYQRHVGSALAFIQQCRVYLHFKQGARPHDWQRTGSPKQRCFLPVTQQLPRIFSVQDGVGSEGAAHQLENQKWTWSKKPTEQRAGGGVADEAQMAAAADGKWKHSHFPQDSFKWSTQPNAF